MAEESINKLSLYPRGVKVHPKGLPWDSDINKRGWVQTMSDEAENDYCEFENTATGELYWSPRSLPYKYTLLPGLSDNYRPKGSTVLLPIPREFRLPLEPDHLRVRIKARVSKDEYIVKSQYGTLTGVYQVHSFKRFSDVVNQAQEPAEHDNDLISLAAAVCKLNRRGTIAYEEKAAKKRQSDLRSAQKAYDTSIKNVDEAEDQMGKADVTLRRTGTGHRPPTRAMTGFGNAFEAARDKVRKEKQKLAAAQMQLRDAELAVKGPTLPPRSKAESLKLHFGSSKSRPSSEAFDPQQWQDEYAETAHLWGFGDFHPPHFEDENYPNQPVTLKKVRSSKPQITRKPRVTRDTRPGPSRAEPILQQAESSMGGITRKPRVTRDVRPGPFTPEPALHQVEGPTVGITRQPRVTRSMKPSFFAPEPTPSRRKRDLVHYPEDMDTRDGPEGGFKSAKRARSGRAVRDD